MVKPNWFCLKGCLGTRPAFDYELALTYDANQNLFFVNFEHFSIRSPADIAAVEAGVTAKLKSLGHKVYAIVNYDHFSITPDLVDDYSSMVYGLVLEGRSRMIQRISHYLRLKSRPFWSFCG